MANKEKNTDKSVEKAPQAAQSCRLSKVGGQAVLEGVMMKAGEHTVTTCRQEGGGIVVADDSFVSVRKKHKILNLPIIRGIVNMVEMLMLSVKTLGVSADALGIEEEDSKFEKWLKKHFGASITDFIMVLGVILGVGLSLLLFMFLPIFVADGIEFLAIKFVSSEPFGIWKRVIEGVLKAGIFIAYLALVALMPDIKRTFMYHGAEHKTIACFEAGEELTPENAMKHKRFHPRCGTSFMFFMILLGILAGMALNYVPWITNRWIYTGIRLLILPLIVGVGYEFIMYAGKHDNIFVRILSAPGLWVQRLTTKEPTPDMLEIAIISTKCALRDEFPEYMEFFLARPWEKKEETADKDAPVGDEVNDDTDSEPASDAMAPANDTASDAADAPATIADDGTASSDQ